MINHIFASTILGMDKDIFIIIISCLGALALIGFIFYLASIFVDKNHVKIIERAGKFNKVFSSGWHLIFPVLDKVVADFEIERRVFNCKKELSVIGEAGRAFIVTYSFSYFISNPKDYYYLTKIDEDNIEFISSQIIVDYYNNLFVKAIKSIYDANNDSLIAYINERISNYGIKVESFVIRTAVNAS